MKFLINEHTRLITKYFRLVMHEVDEDALLSESCLPNQGHNIYDAAGFCVARVVCNGRDFEIFYTERIQWNAPSLQSWLRRTMRDNIIDIARKVLPERLHYWEAQKGLSALDVKVRTLRGYTLGCEGSGSIALSPMILLMPEKYMDNVILHEMAHLKYQHHRKSFWRYLSTLLGEDACLLESKMEADMKNYFPYFKFLLKY